MKTLLAESRHPKPSSAIRMAVVVGSLLLTALVVGFDVLVMASAAPVAMRYEVTVCKQDG